MDFSETIQLEKLVHGGQALGRLRDGRAVFVWGGLPGEQVRIRPIKQKKDYVLAVTTEVLATSPDRVEPKDPAYLSTSPWQILTFSAENTTKQTILTETMQRAGVLLPDSVEWKHDDTQWQYRNKMEYSFWGDEDGLHLAFYQRGSNKKQIVHGSSLAMPVLDEAAQAILGTLGRQRVRAGQLKTLLLRASQTGKVAASLYVKDESFPDIQELSALGAGINVHFSTPKSPASVITRTLKRYGSTELSDKVQGRRFQYDVDGFFQVNVPMFERALRDIKAFVSGAPSIIDMYAGVGAIGLSVGAERLVELDAGNVRLAQQNAGNDTSAEITHASTEKALSAIEPNTTVIFDPPRSGLHPKLTRHIVEVRPAKLVYLSCNPATQARDIAQLQPAYRLTNLVGYNFFPKTPHIESLAVLELS